MVENGFWGGRVINVWAPLDHIWHSSHCCSSPDVWPGRSIRFHLVSSSPSSQTSAISKSQIFAEVKYYNKNLFYECVLGVRSMHSSWEEALVV